MTASAWPFPVRGVTAAILTAILGPLAGNVLLWTLIFIPKSAGDGFSEISVDGFSAFAAFLLYTSVFAYVVAGAGSLIAGLALGLQIARHGTVSNVRAMATGALAMCAGIIPLEMMRDAQPDGSMLPFLFVLAPLAAVSALFCRQLFALTGLISDR